MLPDIMDFLFNSNGSHFTNDMTRRISGRECRDPGQMAGHRYKCRRVLADVFHDGISKVNTRWRRGLNQNELFFIYGLRRHHWK